MKVRVYFQPSKGGPERSIVVEGVNREQLSTKAYIEMAKYHDPFAKLTRIEIVE